MKSRTTADQPSTATEEAPKTWLALRCYRQQFARYTSYRVARLVMEHHIRDCPEGAMPWAKRIGWHMCEGEQGRASRAWVTSANGEWLDHTVWEMND